MNNQIKLLIISFVVLILSSLLIWQGINPVINSDSAIPSASPIIENEKDNQVLGEESASVSAELKDSLSVIVEKVIDGDTIEVTIKDKRYKVRYIGINTPETVDPRRAVECFGKEASNENRRLVEGRSVTLKKDVSETDKYGRLLRFVYVKLDDGNELFVNDYLIRQGFAYASSYPPDVSLSDRFYQAQKEARENNRGLWGICK